MKTVICIKCLVPREISLMRCVFATGFKQINGINYSLGVCKDCPGNCNDDLSHSAKLNA